MSLFPQGASSGMGGFSRNPQNEAGKEGVSESLPLPSTPETSAPILNAFEDQNSLPPSMQEADLVRETTGDNTLNHENLSPLQKTLLSQNDESGSENSNIFIQGKDEQNTAKSTTDTQKEEFIAMKKSEEIQPKNPETSSVPQKKEAIVSSPAIKGFPTSVKIAGLTAAEDAQFESNFHTILGDGKQESHDENNIIYENLSDSERAKLEDMNKLYFEFFPSDSNPAGGIALDELLELAIDKEASDIHFSAESKIGLRINGHIRFIDSLDSLTREQARALIFALVPNPLHRRRIFEEKELDCAYEHKSGVNFRVNIFFKRGKIGGVLRKIASHAMTMEQLGLPEALSTLLGKKQGLLLVTGPTGSGKSTSMQSMLELINATRVEHILTIEDPIEYIFTSKKSIFSQREVGGDTASFAAALRASLREDPDIVMIGEMRDAETIQAAMNLSETGHFVISTLHTSSAPQTIARLVSNFPSNEQEQVQSRLADTLIGVLSQRLVSRTDREGRVALFELMIVNSAIRNIIRTGDMTQIHNAMLAGREIGMVRMEDYAQKLAEQGIVAEESFKNFFREE